MHHAVNARKLRVIDQIGYLPMCANRPTSSKSRPNATNVSLPKIPSEPEFEWSAKFAFENLCA
jgi:hypothetical protein